MFTSRALTGTLVVGAVAIASLFAASPASAATLPAGQKITIIDQWSDQFYNASPVNADVTPVGTPTEMIAECVTGVDVDDNGHGYAIASLFARDCEGDFENGFLAAVYSADANTGLLTNQVQVTIDDGDDPFIADECTSIDYSAGVVRAACYIYPVNFAPTAYIGSLDPTTGVLTPEIVLNVDTPGFNFHYLTSIALDPTSGILYGFSWGEGDFVGGDYRAWTLSAVDGIDEVTTIDQLAYGADFDRNGQLWITTLTDQDQARHMALATLSLVDGSSPFVAQYTTPDAGFVDWSEAITVWGAPALPATGPSSSTTLGAGAALFLLVGAILAAGTIGRRRSVEG
jgi:hypothetical protein